MNSLKRFLLVVAVLGLCGVSLTARAALAIIVHPSNPVAGITAEETAQIFLGKTSQFAAGRHATPVDQPLGSAARGQFYKGVVKKTEDELLVYWSKMQFAGKAQPPRELADAAAVKAFVAANPDAIGYVDGKLVDGSVKVLMIVP